MVNVETLLLYLPKQHGEHGVDATLHTLTRRQFRIHEVFSNPPGGSWTQFDILRPLTNEVYRWDHMPRVPSAKRPNFVLQFNEAQEMNFLLIESKQTISDVYPRMGTLLTQFFTGSRNYLGLRNRPAWQRKQLDEERWALIPPSANDDVRYWFKRYPESRIHFWPGFAFALEPEHIVDVHELNMRKLESQLTDLLRSYHDLQVAIMIGWVGKYHKPFVIMAYSDEFGKTNFGGELNRLLEPALVK